MLSIVSYAGVNINDGSNYVAAFAPGGEWGLPRVAVQTAPRLGAWPLVTGVRREAPTINLVIRIVGSDIAGLRHQLLRLFSPEGEVPQRLVISDTGGSNPRYVLAVPEIVSPVNAGEVASQNMFAVQLRVSGDVRWRSTTEVTDTWSITASGQTRVINNTGTDEAYPVIVIRPTQAKTGGYAYRRWVPIIWLSANSTTRYPVRMTLNTQTLISGGKMQSSGNDLRIIVDGVENDRWLADINTTSTKIWTNLAFQPTVSLTLRVAIPSSGTIASIEVNEGIEGMPESGILLIDSEAFVYTGRVISERKFTGITRAARGTSMAAHTVNTPVYWIQRDVWLVYGNPTVGPPTPDARYSPAFSLSASSNTSWVYDIFNDVNELRTGGWQGWNDVTLTGRGGRYTETERTLSDSDYGVIGAWIGTLHGTAYGWYLHHRCGITNVTWTGGKRRRAGNDFLARCLYWPRGGSWWVWQYDIPSPASPNVWATWSYSGAAFPVSHTVALIAYFYPQDVEVGAATVTLNSSEVPIVSVGSELGGYTLDCILENVTTGEAISVLTVMPLNTDLTINCDQATVTAADGSRQMAALTPRGAPRRRWLRLVSGNNTLQFTDVGTTAVTLTTRFERRFV